MTYSSFLNLPEGMQIDVLSLSFKNKDFESNYLKDNIKALIKLQRLVLLIAILILSAFGALDLFVLTGESLLLIQKIRFIFTVPIPLLFLILSFLPFFLRNWHIHLAIAVLLASVGVASIIIAAPFSTSVYNFPGLMLMFFSSILLRIRFFHSLIFGSITLLYYLIGQTLINPIPFVNYVNNSFFFIGAFIISLIACYLIELYDRREYYLSKRLEKERDIVNKALEEEIKLNNMKSRFINVTSHVFKNPLTSIINSTSVIDRMLDDTTQSNAVKYNKIVLESAMKINNTLGRVQIISKLETKEFVNNKDKVIIEEVVESALKKVNNFEKIHQTIVKKYSSSFAYIFCDRNLLEFTLIEIISNAVKFSPKHSEIQIHQELIEDKFVIRIIDEGSGIKDEYDELHQAFYNFESSGAITGMGLGFAIALRCLELINGELKIRNRIDSSGAEVSIILPSEFYFTN